jgi:hypothetical protein
LINSNHIYIIFLNISSVYTGLGKEASIRNQEGKAVKYALDRNYNVEVVVTIPAEGYTWLVVE